MTPTARFRTVAEERGHRLETSTDTTLTRRSVVRPPRVPPAIRCVHSPDTTAVGTTLILDGATFVLGRGPDAANRIQDRQMSRNHLRLEPMPGGGYRLMDLGSANGTFMDGQRVSSAPFDGSVLSMGNTLFVRDDEPDVDHLPSSPSLGDVTIPSLLGASAATRALRRSVRTVADHPSPVLLLGPTGAGKEVTARAIHDLSGRPGPFLAINCAAIPGDLAEAEAFGFIKGAFTGADRDRSGFFEQAHDGTLFLDEVGDLPINLQAKLLRVLEDSSIRRIGSSEVRTVNVRVIAATHVELERSSFRRDLLARLGDWILRIPPLAERKVDILTLWDHYFGAEGWVTTPEFKEALLLHDWPMNVRELRKLARRLAELAPSGEPLDFHLLPRAMRRVMELRMAADHEPEPAIVDEVDDANTPGRARLISELQRTHGNVKKVALENNWHRTQVYRWLKRLRIDPQSYR
ncbi:MAG: sigma 54-interacting transcriptional regulator [Myxococcota bacterium]